LLRVDSEPTALGEGRRPKVKAVGVEEDAVSEVVLVVDAMVGAW
jgi:hypothetical protein